jgi:signal peptidase II
LLAIAGGVVVLDQWTKNMLRSRLVFGQNWPEQGWIAGLFKLARTENSGAAFSMGQGLGPLFMLLAIAASLALLYYYPRLPDDEPILRVLAGLMLGGTLGNLIDRLTVGQVTDFIVIRYFAIVNIADISLTLGTAGLILWFLIKDAQEKKRAAGSQ